MQIYRYDPAMVQPMREELTRIGFRELLTPQDADEELTNTTGSLLVVVNSVCGCAAGAARPGVRLALEGAARPDRLATVFAGMDTDAVEAVRSRFVGYPPSSPQIGLFKEGELVFMMERQDIEGRPAEEISEDLSSAFARFCSAE
jgi:putative YphP/YqiW family bacilliredoxin